MAAWTLPVRFRTISKICTAAAARFPRPSAPAATAPARRAPQFANQEPERQAVEPVAVDLREQVACNYFWWKILGPMVRGGGGRPARLLQRLAAGARCHVLRTRLPLTLTSSILPAGRASGATWPALKKSGGRLTL